MDHEHDDEESPVDFKFPMSKHEKMKHANFESNINSIIEDDEDEVPSATLPKSKPDSIVVQKLSSNDGEESENTENKLARMNINDKSSPDKNLRSSPNTLSKEAERKKLSILSNGYRPKGKTVKKGKLKKPQSQKEPTLNYPRDFCAGLNPQPCFTRGNYAEHPTYVPGPLLLPTDDKDVIGNSNFYNNERSTTSSNDSNNMYQGWEPFQPNMSPYLHQGYQNLYPGNYYPQPPGLVRPQNMIPRQASNPGYPDFLRSPNMAPPPLATSKSALDVPVPSESGKIEGANQNTLEKRVKSPLKTKKGFRKVKSTNEKSMPIDPAARTLIFNCDKTPNLQDKLNLLKGQLDLIIYNQAGSRFLQKMLTKANKEVIEFFLSEIDSSLNKLMMDKYGNYFCQELLLSCSGAQRLQILEKIQENFIQVCKDKKGTHTIQKMVDLVNLPEEEKFFERTLTGHVGKLAIDQQGTHIIQKIITSFTEENRQFAFEEIKEAFLSVSKTSHGLCVVKKLVANTTKPENRKSMVKFISENAIQLVQDPYGNYAVQEIMERWPEQDYIPVINKIKEKVAQLSIQKFSSNVVEKCLQISDPEEKNDIIMHIAKVDKLVSVMRNSYGNYVVQKALYLSNGDAKIALADSIYKNIPNIQDKKIKLKWAQLLHASIANDLNFAGRYDLEEYLKEANDTNPNKASNQIDLNRNSSSYDSNIDMSFPCERKLSPTKAQRMAESPGMVHPSMLAQPGYSNTTNSPPPYYNFEALQTEGQDYQNFSPFNSAFNFGPNYQN